ncbi:hypothetical protein PMAYCL1PPCAC_28129 [Pristionchus mayeri]|uniref:Uncharacterized protein n=1 Tax=Pristionchus mayeri TaxID=1317129 RepID=A0AAN5D7N8_9BILA|nr:hypothetical protein PMAYCL1PPCAC_28129 [Pristionchus mayeri]
MSNSEICAAEFADWTLFDADLGNDFFLEECMALFSEWCIVLSGIWCTVLEEEDSEGWSDVETMVSEECTSCGVTRYCLPSEADAVRCPCEDVSSAFTDSDVSSSVHTSEIVRPHVLANGRVQDVSMCNTNSDYSSTSSFSEASFADSEESMSAAMSQFASLYNRVMFNDSSGDSNGSSSSEQCFSERVLELLAAKGLVAQSDEQLELSESGYTVLTVPIAGMQLFAAWTEENDERLAEPAPPAPIRIYCGMSTGARQCQARLRARRDEDLELSMKLFAAWTEEMVEPDTHDSLLMAALLSTKEESSAASADLRAASCPDLLMNNAPRVLSWEDYIVTYPSSDSGISSSEISVTGSVSWPSLVNEKSSSSLFPDPTSAHSDSSSTSCCALCCVPVPFCAHVNRGSTIEEEDDEDARAIFAFIDALDGEDYDDNGYETDVDSAPVVSMMAAAIQTEETDKAPVAQMLADCDSLLEELIELKKKLMEKQ